MKKTISILENEIKKVKFSALLDKYPVLRINKKLTKCNNLALLLCILFD
jgi:hypothetical protein